MERFAKLFEAYDKQLLVRKCEDDNENPKLSLIIVVEDSELDLGFSYKSEELRDKAFDLFNDESANSFLKILENANDALSVVKAIQGGKNNG